MNDFEFFYGTSHPLSQWYPSNFIIDNIFFNSAEQWMMYSKAHLFGDIDACHKILKADHPSLQRRLGRQVRYYSETMWLNHCKTIVYRGNYEKFTQNKSLKIYLLNTGNKVLAEATATDLRWGIGKSINDPDRFDIARWTGLNWLGIILMQLRKDIREALAS